MVMTTIKRQDVNSSLPIFTELLVGPAIPGKVSPPLSPPASTTRPSPDLSSAWAPPQLQHPKWAALPAQKSSNLPLALLPFIVILLKRTQIPRGPH